MKQRILIIALSYPHATHSYINNEVKFLANCAEVLVLSPRRPSAPFYSPINFNYFDSIEQLEKQACHFQPSLILCWMLPNHCFARHVAEVLNTPFIIKTHTPDIFQLTTGNTRALIQFKAWVYGELHQARSYRILMASFAKTARSPQLQAVFCIPALRKPLAPYFPEEKLRDMQPWIFYDQFHNEKPNSDNLLVQGSIVNRRENQTTLAKVLSEIKSPIDWIAVPTPGCLWLDVPGVPDNVQIRKYVPPSEMPALYKSYKAMITVGHGEYGRGLPMSILEAQAAGVTVIAPSLRPDFDQYVTDGGGFIFKHEQEIPDLLERIPDQHRREMGFNNAANYGPDSFIKELEGIGVFLD